MALSPDSEPVLAPPPDGASSTTPGPDLPLGSTERWRRLTAAFAHELRHPLEVISSNEKSMSEYLTILANLVTEYDRLVKAMKTRSKEEIAEHRRRIKSLREREEISFVLEDAPVLQRETDDSVVRLRRLAKRLDSLVERHPDDPDAFCEALLAVVEERGPRFS